MRASDMLSLEGMQLGTAKRSDVRRVFYATYDGRNISAAGMARLFPDKPELHAATPLWVALKAIGCEDEVKP